MNELVDTISKQGEQAEEKAQRAKGYWERTLVKAGEAAEAKDHGKAEYLRRGAAGYLNDYFYWHGQAVALSAVAAGLGLRGMVEREMDEEARCP